MKISRLATASSLMLAVLFCCSGFFSVSAQSNQLSEQQIKNIKNGCSTMKLYLNQTHTSDTLTRVNSGQIYDSILNKLMEQFNTRIASNNFENAELVAVSSTYEMTLDTFRTDYIKYEKLLSKAISIDCETKASEFFDAVLLAREARILVHTDVAILNQQIDNYKLAVEKFESDYKSVVEEISR